jgi:hypothetical protein
MTNTDVEKQEPVAQATAVVPKVSYVDQEKEGAKCCFVCCDYRRAVIICNIILLVVGAIGLVIYMGSANAVGAVGATYDDINDDDIISTVEDAYRMTSILYGVSLGSAICGLVGGVRFNIPLVSIQIFWLVVAYFVGIYFSVSALNDINDALELNGEDAVSQPIITYVISGILTAIWVYPHVGFVMEVKNGIMSLETYPREKYSCCCS